MSKKNNPILAANQAVKVTAPPVPDADQQNPTPDNDTPIAPEPPIGSPPPVAPEKPDLEKDDSFPLDLETEITAPLFSITFAMDILAEDLDEALLSIQKALDDQYAPDGTVFPAILVGERFHKAVLERYINGVRSLDVPLDETELVIADPATDPVLKSLNFSRYLQGNPETWFYLRYL